MGLIGIQLTIIVFYNLFMVQRKCFELCPHITKCRERLIVDSQTPAVIDQREAAAKLDELVKAAAGVAIAACAGPRIEERMVEKGGYFESKKPVIKDLYVCGEDGYAQRTAFYYQKDKMPR